jgi:hypothetical protein
MSKKKFNKNVIWLFDEIYMQEYLVIFAPTHKKFCELAKEACKFVPETVEEDSGISGEFHGLTCKCSSLGLIWSSDKSYNLIHELVHACAWTLRNRDIHLTPDAEESYAYYYAYLYRTIMEEIRERRDK